jgi:hypothetical protein
MFNPIVYIHSAGLVHPKGSRALDVGTKEGNLANQMVVLGYRTWAIDMVKPTQPIRHVRFRQVRVERYNPRVPYDLIIARNVLQFTADPLLHARRLAGFLTKGGIFGVTFFGEDDLWVKAGSVQGASLKDALIAFEGMELLHWGTFREYGPSMKSRQFKLWHMHNLVVRRPA